MSKYKGNIISSTAAVSSGSSYTGRADGKWTPQDQIQAKKANLWAKGLTVPTTPTVTAIANDNGVSATVTVSVSDNGGSAISSYTITSSGGQTATSSTSTIIISGLTVGTTYTFTATVTNATGTSATSPSSNSVTMVAARNVILAHFNNSWADSSNAGQTITPQGTATFSTSISKFGGASSYYDGSSNSRAIATLSPITGDFTFEFFLYYLSGQTNTTPCIVGIGPGELGANEIGFVAEYSSVGLNVWFPNGLSISAGQALATNTWTHVAVSRQGVNTRFFVNGVQKGTTMTATFTFPSQNLYLGDRPASAPGGNFPAKCYIDDVRLVKQALYTANFTPSTSELQTI
jgi:hypothetical protein